MDTWINPEHKKKYEDVWVKGKHKRKKYSFKASHYRRMKISKCPNCGRMDKLTTDSQGKDICSTCFFNSL